MPAILEEPVFASVDPRTREMIKRVRESTPAQIACAASAASAAATNADLRKVERRAAFLRALARRLRERGPELHEICGRETGLPAGRLANELDRTCFQADLFAELIEEGSYVDAVLDTADANAPVAPRPDLRRMLVPIGPVAVFGASNFPYAFGVAGGDSVSALAAGCPVIAKSHPSHPGTSELVDNAMKHALSDEGLPAGAFSLVQGASESIGRTLVQAPEVEAVAFTGSLGGGRALLNLAAARKRPIPVFAEMGSINPYIVTSGALDARGGTIADALAASVLLGGGQFCTKPGLALVPEGDAGDAFVDRVASTLSSHGPVTLLNEAIRTNLARSAKQITSREGVVSLTDTSAEAMPGVTHLPAAWSVRASQLLQDRSLLSERFGPVFVVARYASAQELIDVASALDGQLSATVEAEAGELSALGHVISLLADRVGRLLFGGVPTGVAVAHAMHHGGPYPATTAAAHTSVGTTAIARFLRPIAFQDAPEAVLPEALRSSNPLGILRKVNGWFTRSPISSDVESGE
jgi:NADP-dependent aldehyde dehydrogenase